MTKGDLVVLAFAIVTTVAALALLGSFVREARVGRRATRRVERRRRRSWLRRDPRESLALVGNALAATHDPRALLPVILEVTVEATGARGGRVIEGGRELAWIGEDADEKPLQLPLAGPGQESELLLVLDPPKGGFSPEAVELAEWLVSQAAIALENAELHHVVQWQATTDDLTGLANRRRFMEALAAEIQRVERLGGTLSILLADIDDFKRINDRWGHQVGDEALRRFAGLLAGELREVDIAGRLGGEEFAVLLPGTDREGALIAANRIRGAVAREVMQIADATSVRFTVSLGVAAYVGGSAESLLKTADAALYRAKAEGKNRVALAEAV